MDGKVVEYCSSELYLLYTKKILCEIYIRFQTFSAGKAAKNNAMEREKMLLKQVQLKTSLVSIHQDERGCSFSCDTQLF